MSIRVLLLSVCLAGSLSVLVASTTEKGARRAPLRLEFLPAGNLQVGAPGELLAQPIAVRTAPGAVVRFASPDMGILEESGKAEATVTADADGIARVHVRLGANLGSYTVVAGPATGAGTELRYTFRAARPEALAARQARILAASATQAGGAR